MTVQRLVPADRLQPAYAMDTVSYNLGRALAPIVTMTIGLAGVNFAWAFAANALSFLAFSVILWKVLLRAAPEPERRSHIRDGFQIARNDGRIMALLLMVAAVTVADDPILVLGPALAKQMNVPPVWSGWFIAALGAGTVAGSFRRSRHQHTRRLAATALAALALCMLVFVFASSMWLAIAAALGAGASCLVANSVTRAVLAEQAGPDRTAAVMAVWAIAWAGSKPFASLVDGLLGSSIGPQWTGMILAVPALVPIVIIVLFPKVGFWLTRMRGGASTSPGTASAVVRG